MRKNLNISKVIVVLFLLFISTSNAQYPVGTWSSIAPFIGSPRCFASAFSIDTMGYVGLGFDTALQRDFYLYYPDSNVWHPIDSFPGLARSSAVSFSNDSAGWGFIGSGYAGGTSWYYDYWKYSQASDSWTQVNSTNQNLLLSQAVGLSIGTNAYVTTGIYGAYSNNATSRYDMIADTWTNDTSFGGINRYAATGFTIGQTIYVGTGINDSTYFSDFWSFNPTTHVWTQEADFGGTARFGAVGFSLGGFGYLGLGNDLNTSYRQDFWLYDPNANIWTFVAHFIGTGRKYAVAFTIHDSVAFVGTGIDVNGNTNDFYEYAPDTALGINQIKSHFASASIYPNPSNGIFRLIYDLGNLSNADLVINDERGQQVAYFKLLSNQSDIIIDQSNLKNGIYFYSIMNKDKSLNSGKICIMK